MSFPSSYCEPLLILQPEHASMVIYWRAVTDVEFMGASRTLGAEGNWGVGAAAVDIKLPLEKWNPGNLNQAHARFRWFGCRSHRILY